MAYPKGSHLSDEHRRRISEALRGRPSHTKGMHLSAEHKQKLSQANRGYHHTDEAKKKISEALRGRSMSYKTYAVLNTMKRFGYNIKIDGVSFDSAKAAADHFGISYHKFIYQLKKYGDLSVFGLHLDYVSQKVNKKR